MDEVTGGFPFHFSTCICKVASGNSRVVQCRQSVMLVLGICTYLVYVLGIYEATAHTRLHVDEVELNDTRDVTPVFIVQVVALTLLCGQLQIHT